MTSRFRPVALLLGAVVMLSACGSGGARSADISGPGSEAPARERPITTAFGFSPGGDFRHRSDEELAADLDRMVEAGATWIRIDVDWSVVEVEQGTYRWESVDRIVEAATGRGLSVLGMVAYTPAWARPPSTTDKHPPDDLGPFADFAAAAAERFGPRGVATWEIWNEPNSSSFWQPAPDPARYAEMLSLVARAIRRIDPAATIVSGGLAPAVDGVDGARSPMTFLTGMLDAGGLAADAVGIHPYSFPARPLDAATADWNTFQRLPEMRSVLEARGYGATELWLTEYGAPTAGDDRAVSEELQSAIVLDGLDVAAAWPWTGPLFLYRLRDPRFDADDIEANFGLLTADGAPKRAWVDLVAATNG